MTGIAIVSRRLFAACQVPGLVAGWLTMGALPPAAQAQEGTGGAATSPAAAPVGYPPTRAEALVERLHGQDIADPYRWLEGGDEALRAEIGAWTAAQNAYTSEQLGRNPERRAALLAELEELFKGSVASPPVRYGTRSFFSRRDGLQNHPVIFVREGADEPRAVLDPNAFSADGTVALDWWFPSPDGAVIAYGRSAGGTELSTLHLRDVRSGLDTALRIPFTRACALAWDKDGQGFHYTRYPEPGSVPSGDENYYRHIYYHRFGDDWREDKLVFGAGRPKEEWPGVTASSDNKYQFVSVSRDWSRNDLYVKADGPGAFEPVALGLDARFDGDALGGRLLIRTSLDAPRYRVMSADPRKPDQETWKELIPQQEGVIEQMLVVGGKIVLHIMENANSRLVVFTAEGERQREIKLPAIGSVRGLTGRPDKPDLHFSFESYAYPTTVFRATVELDSTLEPLERLATPAGLDELETQQVWFTSRDGTRVPMFVTARRGLPRDGSAPALLVGYGGFDVNLTPGYSRGIVPWLRRGGVYAVANLRGGGEFGAAWHAAGRLERKQNVFDDFHAAAEKLIADGFTRADRLGARGGSNGGLLMGAVLTQRPELYRAVISEVPLLDMLRYHRFSVARLWIPEYGCADDPAQFAYLVKYSPYHRVTAGTVYPAVMFMTAEGDSRVDPMHARKMAARMQAEAAPQRRVLLRVEDKAGHGQGKPLRMQLEAEVDKWTFFMDELGMK